MKNIFKWMIPCLAVAFSLTSCNDTMDDKDVIDAQYVTPTTATVALGSVDAVDFQTITAALSVTNESQLIEQGVQISSTADFNLDVQTYASDTLKANDVITIAGVQEQSTYYLRAYAVTKTAGIIVTEVKSVTTPKAPIFPLDGAWTATEWDLNQDTGEWENGGSYDISVEFDPTDPTIVNITNIWDCGTTVLGQYDEATGLITVPNMQVIYVHPKYGNVWIRGVNSAVTGYTKAVTFQFTALGGKMQSTPMAAQCSAGDFAYFYLTMEHK